MMEILKSTIFLDFQVARLQEQLQKERDLRVALEAGLKMSHGKLPNLTAVDEKVSFRRN